MGENWEPLLKDPIVSDIKTVIKQGIHKFDAGKLVTLPALIGGQSGPADESAIRKELIFHLMVDDPDKAEIDSDLSQSTQFNLAIFRALPETKFLWLDGARTVAGRIYRPEKPLGGEAVRKRPSAKKPSSGPEWKLIVQLRERIVEKARKSDVPLPPGVAGATLGVDEEVDGSSLVEERRRHGERLDEAWGLLELCRSSAPRREGNLELLRGLASGLAEDTDLNEARALVEFAAYESNRGLEKYRLEQGVRLLEAALNVHGREARVHSIRLLLMREWAHLAVYGGLLESDRRKTLDQIVDLGRESLTDSDLDPMTRQYMRVAVAEALKELCFVTHDAEVQKWQYERARSECEAVVADLAGDDSPEAVRLIAHAKRHEAITYELQEDKERDGEARLECLRTWSRLCLEGAEMGERVGDDHIRAYCLLNLGSTQSRHTRFMGVEQSKVEALAAGKEYLDEALPLVEALADERGRAWVYLHLCENTELRAELEQRGSVARIELVRDLEKYAIQALNHLKHLDDPLGLTVAHLQVGKALCMMHEETEADAATAIRLERAIDLLTRAVAMTQEIGYYQEYPAAARWLARSLEHRWASEEPSSKMLIEGINALITGICECYAGQEAIEELGILFKELSEQLEAELRKRR